MTLLGVAGILAAIVALALKRGYPTVLAMAMVAPVGYAVILGSNGIPLFYLFGAGAAVMVVVRALTAKRTPGQSAEPGRRILIAFVVYSAAVTLLSPAIFAGIEVLTPRGDAEYGYLDPGELGYTISNLAQLAYLILAAAVVLYLARTQNLNPHLLGIGLALITIVSSYRLLSSFTPLPWPEGFLDNAPSARFIDTTERGEARFRGVYSEPSGLATGSIVSVVYFLLRLPQVHGWKKIGVAALIAAAILNAAVSTSATSVIAGALVAVVMLAAWLIGFLFRRTRLHPVSAMVGLVGVVVLATMIPAILSVIRSTIESRVGGTSYDTRLGGNFMAFDVLLDTWFLGAGLGSHKPFAIWATLIAGTGLVGTILFASLVVTLVRRGVVYPELTPTIWALIAVLICKSVAGSSLWEPIIWVSLGVIANRVWGGRPPREPVAGVAERVTRRSVPADRP